MISTIIAATSCTPSGGSFLGFPTWYKYLPGIQSTSGTGATICSPHIAGIADVWLIALAVIEMLLRIAALAAIVFVIWGSVQLLVSQGEPDKVNKGRQTVINAVVGLGICVVAITLVTFAGGRFN